MGPDVLEIRSRLPMVGIRFMGQMNGELITLSQIMEILCYE
jgi:hypothetical protein